MEKDNKTNGNNTGNYPYGGDRITQADLGDSGVGLDDPRIIHHKNAVRDDKESFDSVEDCNMDKMVDESYRIDDNADYSTSAQEEHPCMEGDMTPGVGIMYSDVEEEIDTLEKGDKVYNNKEIRTTYLNDEERNQ